MEIDGGESAHQRLLNLLQQPIVVAGDRSAFAGANHGAGRSPCLQTFHSPASWSSVSSESRGSESIAAGERVPDSPGAHDTLTLNLMSKIRSQDQDLCRARSQLEKLRTRSKSYKASLPSRVSDKRNRPPKSSFQTSRPKSSPCPAPIDSHRASYRRFETPSRLTHTPPLSKKTKELAMKVCRERSSNSLREPRDRPSQRLSSTWSVPSLRSRSSPQASLNSALGSSRQDIDDITFSGTVRTNPAAARRQTNELVALRRKNKQLQAKYSEAKSTTETLSNKLQALQRALNIRASELGLGRQNGPAKLLDRSELLLQIEEANQRYGDLVTRHKKLQTDAKSKDVELSEIQSKLDTELQTATEHSSLVADLERRLESLRVCRNAKETELEELKSKFEESAIKYQDLQSENGRLSQQLVDLEVKSVESKHTATDSTRELEKLRAELDKMKAENTRLRADNLSWQRRFPVLPQRKRRETSAISGLTSTAGVPESPLRRSTLPSHVSHTHASKLNNGGAGVPLSQQLKAMFHLDSNVAKPAETTLATRVTPAESQITQCKSTEECSRCDALSSVEKSVFALAEDTRLLRSEVRAVNEKCTKCEDLFKESQSSVNEMRTEFSTQGTALQNEVAGVLGELRRQLLNDLTRKHSDSLDSLEAHERFSMQESTPRCLSPVPTAHSFASRGLSTSELTTPRVVSFQRKKPSPAETQ